MPSAKRKKPAAAVEQVGIEKDAMRMRLRASKKDSRAKLSASKLRLRTDIHTNKRG